MLFEFVLKWIDMELVFNDFSFVEIFRYKNFMMVSGMV